MIEVGAVTGEAKSRACAVCEYSMGSRVMAATKKLFTRRNHTAARENETTEGDADPPATFNTELAYALSETRYVREHAPTVPILSDIQRKHLDLLDGIALLLVTEHRSDVAAVSFLHTSTSIEFYYAKNRPCTASERGYIESLLGLVRNYDPSRKAEYIRNTLDKITRMCVGKSVAGLGSSR